MIKCKTVSSEDCENEGEFERLEEKLRELFPNVYQACKFEKISKRALLFKWSGECSNSPAILAAHYDVVEADSGKWQKPPFSGEIEDGVIWGRGAIDTKSSLCAILSAAETLIKRGYKPKRDIYFAFGGNEEIGGDGAPSIVSYLSSRGISPSLVLDEGGAVVEGAFPGVKCPCALIGTAEKGMVNVEYSVKSDGGHASAPKPHTPVGILSKACVKVENKPFRFKLCKSSKEMLNTLGRYSSFPYRLIFANLWLFAPILSIISKRRGGELSALLRTTTAFTVMQGSDGANVIPASAKMISNHRIIPGETVDGVLQRIKKTVNDSRIEIKATIGNDPSPISSTTSEGYKHLVSAINETWQDAIASPYLMLACADARHYSKISDNVYRFSPLALTSEERATIHGVNERISVEKLNRAVVFYTRLIEKL